MVHHYLITDQFATLYRALWRRERDIRDAELGVDDDMLFDRSGPDDEVDKVLDRVMVEQTQSVMSPRQQQIADLLAAGQSRREIARTVGVDPHTVARDLQQLRTQMGQTYGWTTEDGA